MFKTFNARINVRQCLAAVAAVIIASMSETPMVTGRVLAAAAVQTAGPDVRKDVRNNGESEKVDMLQQRRATTERWIDEEKMASLLKNAKEKEIRIENAPDSPLTVTRAFMKTLTMHDVANKEFQTLLLPDSKRVSFSLMIV